MTDFVQSQHLVLREYPFESSMMEYADAQGWRHIHTHEGVPGEEPRYVVWDVGLALSLYYAEDEMAPISYVFVRSQTAELASMTLEALRRDLHPWAVEELVAEFRGSEHPGVMALNLIRMVIGASREFTREVLECVEIALHGVDPRLRGAGISATGYLMWPEFRPLLRQAADHDPDLVNRDRAMEMLEEFDDLEVEE